MGVILHNTVVLDDVKEEKVVYIADINDLLGHNTTQYDSFANALKDLKERKKMHDVLDLTFKVNSVKRYTITIDDVTQSITEKL